MSCALTDPGEELEEAIEAYKKAVQGGIEVGTPSLPQRAEQNVRNCMAKIMSARLDVENQQKAGGAANDKS